MAWLKRPLEHLDETSALVPDLAGSPGPYRVEVQLLYQPVGYRWANNLKSYSAAPEPARFTEYYESAGAQSAVVLTSASRIGTCCGE